MTDIQKIFHLNLLFFQQQMVKNLELNRKYMRIRFFLTFNCIHFLLFALNSIKKKCQFL